MQQPVSGEESRALLASMLLIRRFEETVSRLFAQGQLPGFVHLSLGQEAVATGICSVLGRADVFTSTHRGHGHVLAKGADLNRLMAELAGKVDGYCQGRGGSMHCYSPELGVLGTNAIIGGGFGIAAGAALTFQMLEQPHVSVVFFGDGAANTGVCHEAMNLAAVWRLPLVFICENNLYAEFTPLAEHTAGGGVAARAATYGIPGEKVDGNDVLAVRQAAQAAVARARAGAGPTVLECLTYRHHGHVEGEQALVRKAYRLPEEIAEWKARDPIPRLAERLVAEGHITRDELAALEASVQADVEAAWAFAKASPLPDPATVADHVYVQSAGG